jgi:hypothetical protein
MKYGSNARALGRTAMDIALSPEQVTQVQIYLRAMAVAVEGVGHTVDPEERRSHWGRYCEIQRKLHDLIPPIGDTPADEGPYTPEY